MSRSLVINGKFAAQRVTGVQRVAEQLVRALDARPGAQGAVLILPPQGRHLGLQRIRECVAGPADLPLHVWEQFVLPRAARGSLLLNLAGGAPAFGAQQVALIHDAALFDTPEAYARAFTHWYRWLFRRLARHAEALLTVSLFSRARLSQALKVPPARFEVLPNGADHIDARPVALPDLTRDLARRGLVPGRYLLVVGSANPNKNFGRLLQAHARLPVGRLPLAVVGGADPSVFADAGRAEQADVMALGPVDDQALRRLYQGARALVYPSLYEGFGLPPLEAMASGCPVIVSNAAALPEVCGDAALAVDPLDIDALAAAMQRISDDNALHVGLAAAGRNRASHYRWAATGQQLAGVLARCGVQV